MCDSSKLDSSGIQGLHIKWLLLILVVDVVRRVCETLQEFGRQSLGGIADKLQLRWALTLSITKVARFVHVNPESIHRNDLKKGSNLQKREREGLATTR